MERYRNLGTFTAFPLENSSTDWLIVVGANISGSPGTLTANSNTVILEVEDAQEAVCDTWTLQATNDVAAPATSGTIYSMFLPRKMLVPPGGSVNNPTNVISSILVVQALDTRAVDGKESLENALSAAT